MSKELSIIDKTIIMICLNCNYNDGNDLKINKDYLRSALNDSFAESVKEIAELKASNDKMRAALTMISKHELHMRDRLDAALLMVDMLQNAAKEALKGAE